MLFIAGPIGALASLIGVALSRHFLSVTGYALSTGGIVVAVIGGLFVITIIAKEIQRLLLNREKRLHGTLKAL